jgi:hypothetical protein
MDIYMIIILFLQTSTEKHPFSVIGHIRNEYFEVLRLSYLFFVDDG